MSELKTFDSQRIYWAVEQVERVAGDIDEVHLDDNLFYLKSEADEVIAKLNNRIKFLQVTHSACCNHCNECADGMGKVFDETLDELKKQKKFILEHATEAIRRQKYKRCIAMAKWCRRNRLHASVCGPVEKIDFWEKWRKRWLKIAEQFKENK